MNRIYSLVWNRTLHTVQVASELARSPKGRGNSQAAAGTLRRRPLALACVAAMGMAFMALPAWSATCPAGATQITPVTGAPGTTGGDGNGTPGANGVTASSGAYLCLPSGEYTAGGQGGDAGGDGGYGGVGGIGVQGSDFDMVNNGHVTGGYGGQGFAAGDSAGMGGAGGAAISGSGFTVTNNAGGYLQGGQGGDSKYGNGGTGGNAVEGSDFTLTNSGRVSGGYGGHLQPNMSPDGEHLVGGSGHGGAGGMGVSGTSFHVVNNVGGSILGGDGADAKYGNGGAGGVGISGSQITVDNAGYIYGGRGGSSRFTGNTLNATAVADAGPGYGGAGGAGGAGIVATDHSHIDNALGSVIAGGEGGSGNPGGAGGAGIIGSDITVTNSGQIQGGTGGYAMGGAPVTLTALGAGSVAPMAEGDNDGVGGDGGAGIVATGNSDLSNDGMIAGGEGGAAYALGPGGTGFGGAGGDGVTGTGFTLANDRYVAGGYGGYGYGQFGEGDTHGTGGRGGAGVSGAGFSVDNTSGISGGRGGSGFAFGVATGGAGGAGLAGSGFGVTNSGQIVGGKGGYGNTYVGGADSGLLAYSGAGGAGVGVDNAAGVTTSIDNDGFIAGGEGGVTFARGATPGVDEYVVVENAGAGGAGVAIAGAGTTNVSNGGAIVGGYGGYAYGCRSGSPCPSYIGNGGAGGDGIAVAGSGTTTIDNTGYVSGGWGGWAYSDGPGAEFESGMTGAGGAGISVAGTGSTTINNSGNVYGGSGGGGYGSLPGAGGAGVTGIGFTLVNSGGVYGGSTDGAGSPDGNRGGTGGAGVSGSGFSVTNTGIIVGGHGGNGDYSMGAGGAGVVSTGGSSVVNAGMIAGAPNGDGSEQALAVDFSGGGNTLTLESGYGFYGNVVSSSGATGGNDTLALGGDVDDSFDVSQIVATEPTDWTGDTEYFGFAQYAKTGDSTWELTGTTTAMTPWSLEGGVLSISSDDNLGAAGGGLTFDGGTLQNTAAITTARSITATGAGTLQTDADFTSTGAVAGSGAMTKTGAGTLTFNGNGSGFSGTFDVQSGTLMVGADGFAGASLGGDLTIASGAMLGGFGTIGSLDLYGTLSPGASIGTLHGTGNATFQPGSTYVLDITSAGDSDSFVTSGSVTINGGTVEVHATGTDWAPITRYTIIDAAGGVTGEFSALTGLPTAHGGLFYGTHETWLVLGTSDFNLGDAARTVNQANTAGGITSLGWGSPLFFTIAALDPDAQRNALDQASGEFHASQQAARLDDSRFVRAQMDRRLRSGDADAQSARLGHTALTAWIHGWGHWGRIDGDGNAARMSDNGDGLLVGADLPVGEGGRVGMTGGASRSTLSVRDRSSWARVTQTWLGAYGGFEADAFAFRAGVAYGWDRIPAYRIVALPNTVPEKLSSSVTGNTTTAYIEGAWRIQTSAGSLSPYLNVANVRVHTRAGDETGGEAALHMTSQSMDATLTTLGARGNWRLTDGLALDANLGWQHAFGDKTPERTQRFLAGGDAFTVYGTPLAKNAGVVGLGLNWQVTPNARVTFGYDGLYGGGIRDNSARASINVAF